MLKVGLTGGLASGKTFVAERLRELGCHVIHADRLGHEVLQKGGEAYDGVLREFGPGILGPSGEIDRKALGEIVFADPQQLERLNALVHPHVFRRQESFFQQVERSDPRGIAVVEAAIMIEVGSYRRYGRLIVAWCPEPLQIERFMARDAATEQQARQRLARQMPLDDKRAYADFVIDTSGSKPDTVRQIDEVYRKLRQESLE